MGTVVLRHSLMSCCVLTWLCCRSESSLTSNVLYTVLCYSVILFELLTKC